MILDAETLDLANAIEPLLEDARRAPGRGQARADGVGARDRHDPVPRTRPRPARSCAACAREVRETAPRRRA